MAKKNYMSGEKEIEKVLLDIKEFYSTKTKLHLKNDDKKYRIPDFYLHKYNLAIEYFGTWDYTKSLFLQKINKKKFIRKVDAYNNNNINCIFIYPNEIKSAREIITGAIKEIKEGKKPLAWVLPWLYEDKIEPPTAEDFKDKYEPLDWIIPWLKEKKIEEPKAEDFENRVAPLNWNLPWPNEEKIEKSLKSNFIDEKEIDADISRPKKNDSLNITLTDSTESEPVPVKKDLDMETIIPVVGFILIALIFILVLLFLIAIIFFPK